MVSFRTTSKLRLLAAAAPLGLLAMATPAQAQDKPATPAPAPATTDDQATDSGDIVVTGTLFRRTDTETPSPVTVLTADNMDKRGLTTIADAVNSISAGNGGGIPQNFTGAFASGATAISLRALTTNSTLTLFDGLRPAYYPLADDGQRSIVDLNTIPSAVVERIEVLKDGASATYGADAIAGVVNVILKKEVKGISGRVEGGISERGDSDNQRVQLTAGFGDLSENGYNFYISGEYQHLGSVYNRDRGFPYNTNNLTSINAGGGFTGRNGNFGFTPPASSSSSGATVGIVVPGTPVANNDGLPFAKPIAGGLFQVLGSCASQGLKTNTNAAGSYCEQDLINTYGVIQPEQTRFGATARFTANIGSKAQAYFTANFYQSKVFLDGTPQSIRSNGNPVETRGIALPALLSNGQLNPQNPFAALGQSAIIYYRFGDIPSNLTNLSRTYRVAGGIDGKFGSDDSWGYSVAGTYMRTDLEQTRRGFLNIAGLTKAINNGTYNFINPSLNSQAVRDQISPVLQSRDNSELWQVQATITKDLMQLPGGPMQFGVGGQVRYEAVYDPNPVALRDFITVNPFSAVGNRYVEAAFFELSAPVLKELEINASGRFDHYSIGLSHFSPKVGFKFKPIPQIALRGTYSEGFRAPSIPEISGSVIGFTQYTPGTGLSAADLATLQSRYGNDSYITTTYGLGNNSTGNPDIKPETSRSFTGGVVFSPKSWLNVTVDYYNIRKKNLILSAGGNPASIASNWLLTGAVPAGVTLTLNPSDPANPGLRATPLSVNFLYSNGNTLQTSGLDVEVEARFNLAENLKWTTSFSGTEIFAYNIDDGTGTGIQKFVGTLASYAVTSASGTPRYRATWQNTLEMGPFSLTGTANFVSGYKGYADDNTGPGSTCAQAIETSAQYTINGAGALVTTAGGPLQCTVRHWLDFDVNASVKVTDKFTFYVNVINAFDAKAPFDPNTYGGNNYNPAWSSAGVIGRTFRAGANFKF
jgi:iron complex outermembrane receptor protein